MADAVGNVLRPPGTSQKGPTQDDEILASYAGFTQKGLTIESGSGFLKTGTVLRAGATAGKYRGATTAAIGATPTEAPLAILRKDVDASTGDMLANYVLHGSIKGSKVKFTDDEDGLTVAQLEDLAARLGGKYNPIHDVLS